nr:immunoglobulin heavy chain junction region [Mus musculus]MBK4195524.1 immunoglobulin heavy chain junction region [Mus musculus]
CANSNYEDYW